MTPSFRHFTFVSPSNKPVSYLELDLNAIDETEPSLDKQRGNFSGLILSYNDASENIYSIHKLLVDSFDTILNRGNYIQNRMAFKSYLPSKQKCDQILIETLKKVTNQIPQDDSSKIHFLSFWYDIENRTFYLYTIGIFDFYMYNGKVSGAPIAPLQNYSNMITNQDFKSIGTSIPQKSFHLTFENGLTSDGFFVYCGLPIEKTQPVHNSPLLSKIFYRLKRDASDSCQRDMEERIKKAFPKDSISNLLTAFYYVFGFIPI